MNPDKNEGGSTEGAARSSERLMTTPFPRRPRAPTRKSRAEGSWGRRVRLREQKTEDSGPT
jgi:hypothetical protein